MIIIINKYNSIDYNIALYTTIYDVMTYHILLCYSIVHEIIPC